MDPLWEDVDLDAGYVRVRKNWLPSSTSTVVEMARAAGGRLLILGARDT